MRKSYFCGGSIIALAAMAVLAPAPASAATAAAAASSGLDEVVVVARRAEERLQDVPISVTAITSDSLKQANVSSSSDLIKLVPSLNVQQGATGPGTNYSLRGIRTGVVTYFAEVPNAAGQNASVDDQIWDLSSVQALAGPQGTLFGRNSTGGAILFIPQKPTDQFEGSVDGKLGNYNLREFTGVVNIPLSDMFKIRAGTRIIRRDAVVENFANGPDQQSQEREAYRISALFTPNDRITNYTVADYEHRDEAPYALIGSAWIRNAGCNVGACLPGYTLGLATAIGDAQEARGIRSTGIISPAYTWLKSYGISNNFSFELMKGMTVKYIAAYRHSKSEEGSEKSNTSLPIEYGINHNFGTKTWTHELQLQGKLFERLDYTVGYFNLDTTSRNGTTYALLLPPGATATYLTSTSRRNINDNQSKAVYAQATLAVTQAWNVTAGVRRTEDDAGLVANSRAPQFTFSGPNVCTVPATLSGVDIAACTRTLKGKFEATTYNLSTDYRINQDVLVYATTRRGYNTGGFNGSVPATNTPGAPQVTYDPEFITDYEAGIKADWTIGGAPLRTNLSFFLAKYTDIQRSQRGFLPSGQLFTGTANGPKATIKGAQLESAFKPIPELTLVFNYGWLDTRYDVGSNAFPKGNKFAQAPETTVNFGANYRHPVSAGGDMIASLNYAYQSEVNFQDDQSTAGKGVFQKGYGILDLRLGWENIGDRKLDVVAFVKNATDEEYAIERQDQSALFGFTGSVYNDPRMYGVQVTYRFGG